MYNLTRQQKEALNHSKHISLTANAGSGKTFVLARRFLSILLEEDIDLKNIVAITFTEKAASELYKKIATEIENRMKETIARSELKRLEQLRRELVSAKISTIHSFCTEILKEFPTEAGIDANFIPIDKRVSDELIVASIDEVLQNSIRKNDELFGYIKKTVRLLGSKKTLQAVLKTMIYKRDDVARIAEAHYSQGENETARWFRETFSNYFEKIYGEKITLFLTVVQEVNNRAKDISSDNEIVLTVENLLSEVNNHDELFGKIATIKNIFENILTKSGGTVKATGYISKKKREGIHNHIDFIEEFYLDFKTIDFSDDYKNAELELAKFGYDILRLWKEIEKKYKEKKNQRGYLDFEDLLLFAKDLVRREDVKAYLAERYQYFMIDEYQDTNETQYDIFIPILDYLKRGNLFIVGDEKQSIYMFRGADLKIFEKTKTIIKEVGDKSSLLELPHSFRLSKELVLFTNFLFGKLFANPKLMYNEVKYSNLVYAGKGRKEQKSEIEFLISNGESDVDNEFELVAKKILQLVQQNKCTMKDIAVLARKRKSFIQLEKEFQKYEIPYQIYGGKGFYQRQEIYDVYNYLSFLLNPKGDEALIAILRSPFFMLSDSMLYKISKCKGESFYEKLLNYAESNRDVEEIIFQLQKNLQNVKSKQLSVLIREILHSSGYWAKVAALKDNTQIFANLDKLINTAISFMDKGSVTLFDFVSYLKEAINKTEDESQAIISEDDANVKLMTIHASKGLEFPVVFIIDTNGKALDDRVKAKSVSIDKEFGILTKTADSAYFKTNVTAPVVGIYNYISLRKTQAELKRLLYVAVTRAEHSLFISATLKDNGKPINGSFLSLFMNGLNIDEFRGSKELTGNITVMHEENGSFVNIENLLRIEIPFTSLIEIDVNNRESESGKKNEESYTIQINSINDIEQNEIISASKISVYNQCPFKYYLVYDLGYTSLFYKGKDESLFDEYSKEDNDDTTTLPANIQGSIIHKILEEEISEENLEGKIEELLVINSGINDQAELDKTKLNILNLVKKYLNSDVFKKISSYKNYKNEYEIYIKQNDFYLYGIIDKLIIDDNTACIIDYKTDSLKKYSASEKLENYKYQLIFYAYLVNKINPGLKKIICRLIFIEQPDAEAILEVSQETLKSFEKKMLDGIDAMRKGEYNKNKSHCKSCYFSDSKNRCVVK